MSTFGTTTAPPVPGHGERIAAAPEPAPRRRGGHRHAAVPRWSAPEDSNERPEHVIRIPRLDLPKRKMAASAIFGVGLLIILFFVYLFAFTPLTASRDQQRLAQTLIGQPLTTYSLVAGTRPGEGRPLAVLSVPALGLKQIVVQGTSAADLMNGPGLMPGTALPGAPGNSVILGRRVTFGAPFASIGSLRAGDRIQVVDGAGKFTYIVKDVRQVSPGQHDVIGQTSGNLLTLATSNGGLVSPGRLAVQAKLVGPPVAVKSGLVAVPHEELGLGGDNVAGGLTLLWSLATIIVLVGAVLSVWLWPRSLLFYILVAPIVVACGLMACESLARALPATF